MFDLMLLGDSGQRTFGENGRATLERVTEDIFHYRGSVLFPDGEYLLNHEKVHRRENREYYLTKYVVLSKAVAGDEETLQRIFDALFKRHTNYGPEDVHPEDPYGYNPFAIAREAQEKVDSVKREKDRRVAALKVGYTVIDFMIADGLLAPIIDTERTFAYGESPEMLFTNVRHNAAKRLLLSFSDPITVNGSEMRSQAAVPDKVRQFLMDSQYNLFQAQKDDTLFVHLIATDGSREEMLYVRGNGSSVILEIGRGGYPGTAQYHLREAHELPRTLYRIVDGWGSAFDSDPQPEIWDGEVGFVTGFYIDVSALNSLTPRRLFTNIFGLVKLIQDVTGISSTKYVEAQPNPSTNL